MHREPVPIARALPARPALPAAPSRPNWLDYLLILFGCALSLVLTDLSQYEARPTADTPALLSELVLKSLPKMLFLPLGVLLLWPLFYLTQRVARRSQALTSAEWLWGVTWLAALALTAGIAWQHWGMLPDIVRPDEVKQGVYVGYALTMLALGAIGILIGLVDLLGRWPRPWTHPFFLALVLWPALPLLAIFLGSVELK